MYRPYKYRIYPNKSQIEHINRSIACVRYIYNKALELAIIQYKEKGECFRYKYFQNVFLLQEKENHPWLKEVNAQALQMALRHLDIAFDNFYKKKKNFPVFKSKHDTEQTVHHPQAVKIDWINSKIQIPKCGKVRIKLHRTFEGKIKTCTVSKTPTNKFFISILVETDDELPKKAEIKPETAIGIDLGIKSFAVLSDGSKIENPKYLRKTLKKLEVAQRRLSRKQKGSNNRNKERLKVAKIYEKITNQRNNFLHQLTSKLIKSESQTFILEDLVVKNLVKNHRMAQSISDVSWGKFEEYLTYKSKWNGKNLLLIGRFDPSSKMCSCCGEINQELTLADREWTCGNCHTTHDRDINAAINIKKFGLIQSSKV